MSASTSGPSTLNIYSPRVLILGGCYGGLAAATNLLDLCEGRLPRFAPPGTEHTPRSMPVNITIVDERDGYHHIIGSPLAFASKAYSRKAWVKFSDIPGLQHPSIKIVQGSVTKVDLKTKSAEIHLHGQGRSDIVSYDYLVAATGVRRVWPVVTTKFSREEYLQQADVHIDAIQKADKRVVVIGGGAVGIEMAAELKTVEPAALVTLVHSRDRLLSSEPLPDSFKDAVLPLLRDQDVEVITGTRVSSQLPSSDAITLTLSNGTTMEASVVINAISHAIPTASYLPKDVLNDEGFVEIRASTHFHDDYHLAVGDIAQWSGIKRCGSAMHMGGISGWNIFQHMLAARPHSPIVDRVSDVAVYKELDEFPAVMGIAIGHTAAAYSPQEGVKSGPETLKYLFGDDLGFDMCWKYMRLGESAFSPLEQQVTVVGQRDQSTPPLTEISTDSDSSPVIEPQTPYDAVGNAQVTNFEVLGACKVARSVEVGVEQLAVDD